MYPITDAVKALFDSEQRQVLRITCTAKDGTTIAITDAEVMEDGFNIDRYSCNGTLLEIGTAISSELTLKLDNRQGQFNNFTFEGAELFVEVGIADHREPVPWTTENNEAITTGDGEVIYFTFDNTVHWIPCGYFTPDEQPRRLNTISLHALDRMMRFETVIPVVEPWTTETGEVMEDGRGETIYFTVDLQQYLPMSISDLVAKIASICDVPFSQNLSGFPNTDYVITELPNLQQPITCRALIMWCAGLMGTNAWIDWTGSLRFSWYDNATGYIASTSNRYSSDMHENDISITGLKWVDTDEDNTVYLAGTLDYALDMSNNMLIDSTVANDVLTNLYIRLHHFTYRPFAATVINAPYLWPMDRVVFVDRNGVGHVSLVTNVNFGLNSTTELAASGRTEQTYSYAAPSSFTSGQANVIRKMNRSSGPEAIKEAVDNATAQITGANGGYIRDIYNADGERMEQVIMDTMDINTATKVWRWNMGGLGFSSNGYNGPYTTAITQDGAIVADFITVGVLNAAIIKAGILGDVAGKNYWNMATGEFSLSAETTVGGSTVEAIAQNEAESATNSLDVSLNQQSVFNRLTNNGAAQGIFLRNNQLYINATYINAGTMSANYISGGVIDGSTVQAKELNILDANNDVIASFTDTVVIGRAGDTHAQIDFNSFELYNQDGTIIAAMGDSRSSSGVANITEEFIGDGLVPAYLTLSCNMRSAGDLTVTVGGVQASWIFLSDTKIQITSPIPEKGEIIVANYTTTDPVPYFTFGKANTTYPNRGIYSILEGYNTTAIGPYSHVEGYSSSARGLYGHAEGKNTQAYVAAHSEGYYTYASGLGSHAEGDNTMALSSFQHVFGKYNNTDNQDVYVEIVGNGSSGGRRNARTLDWNGNEWIYGTLTQSSDARLKTECGEVPEVADIPARRFRWNDKKVSHDDKEHLGYFAQDVEAVAPYLVDEDAMGYKSLDYIGLLVAKIASIEKRLASINA